MQRGQKRRFDYEAIVEYVREHGIDRAVLKFGCSRPTIYNAIRAAKTPVDIAGRVALDSVVSLPQRRTKSRHAHKPLTGEAASMPAFDNPALMEGRTLYPSTVSPARDTWALKSGHNSAKIGAEILKGRWKGFPVYTLTLEERATCPRSCSHWRSCFGNKMHLAQRVEAGEQLEWRLKREVAALELQHPAGFVVRLHVLGDFYSVAYVELWRSLLKEHAALRVFGYSARWDYARDPIARALVDLVTEQWARFAIRMSNAPMDACATVTIEHPYQKPDDAVICPAQLGQTESCSTCAFCWQSTKRVAFIQH
jgi:hypothetical protein